MQDVALLADQLGDVEPGRPARVTAHGSEPSPGIDQVAEALARPGVGQLALDEGELAGGVGPLGDRRRRGAAAARTWSMVHVTVATVGMPRRW